MDGMDDGLIHRTRRVVGPEAIRSAGAFRLVLPGLRLSAFQRFVDLTTPAPPLDSRLTSHFKPLDLCVLGDWTSEAVLRERLELWKLERWDIILGLGLGEGEGGRGGQEEEEEGGAEEREEVGWRGVPLRVHTHGEWVCCSMMAVVERGLRERRAAQETPRQPFPLPPAHPQPLPLSIVRCRGQGHATKGERRRTSYWTCILTLHLPIHPSHTVYHTHTDRSHHRIQVTRGGRV